jgi:predicted TIM-barrel fold metal-dependent hydrolase
MVVDACVHPALPQATDLSLRLPAPYRGEILAVPGGGPYPVPVDEHLAGSYPADGTAPGSSRALLAEQVLDGPGAAFAVLLPLTRGLVGDVQLDAAICAATNEWLAETWLDEPDGGRYRGTIRVVPRSPHAAVAEIERWAGDPRFVQVGVPLESHVAYGEAMYYPVWEAAAAHGLPVAVHADRAGGALPAPTTQGYPMSFLEEFSQQPLYVMTHLCSLIAHGVFERLDRLVFVFADGGFDYVQTLAWRMDKEWRASRAEVPWVRKSPRFYLGDHARFVVRRSDGLEDPAEFARFVELNALDRLLLYGSSYPSWDHLPAAVLSQSLPAGSRDAIMGGNAAELYRLPSAVTGA